MEGDGRGGGYNQLMYSSCPVFFFPMLLVCLVLNTFTVLKVKAFEGKQSILKTYLGFVKVNAFEGRHNI